jgi:hypothetical protein
LKTLIPEFQESEDEIHRKWILEYLYDGLRKADEQFKDHFKAAIDWLEKQKAQKPILEVSGFKVGDAVRLKDGDGRKHIIKSFEEVEGVHGPNFYHVEFEDNSARDGIYPGEEYPNGYYTQMEKFEEEQKPVDVKDPFSNANFVRGYESGYADAKREQKPAEWSEEDKEWLSEVYFAIDHSMYSEDERQAMKKYIDSLRKNRKPCDVDEFTLTLRNCLYADSELTEEQSNTFATVYGEDLYKVAMGELKSGLDKEDVDEYRMENGMDLKPGDKFWVRCKTEKSENLWFDKGDERPAYVTHGKRGIEYVVYLNKDGNGSSIFYPNKESLLDTFEIIKKPQ